MRYDNMSHTPALLPLIKHCQFNLAAISVLENLGIQLPTESQITQLEACLRELLQSEQY